MMYRTRAPTINLRNVQDINTVPLIERWSLYFKWTDVVILDLKREIKIQEVSALRNSHYQYYLSSYFFTKMLFLENC